MTDNVLPLLRRPRSARRALFIVVLVAPCLLAASGATAETPSDRGYAGRPLSEVLEELREGGLDLIFSSDLVTPELRVKSEPRAKSAHKLLRELLAPHGLAPENGPGGRILVVRDARHPPGATSEIRGTVSDERTGMPLPGVHVEVVEAQIEVASDAEGRFRIPRLDPGAYTLRVRHPGYVGQRLDNVRVLASRPTEVAFRLLPSPELIEAISVTPSHYRLYGDAPSARQTLSRDEIERIPNLADDINRVVARMPGIANADLSARLFVRGGVDDELLVVVDGMELYDPYHFEPEVSMFSIVSSRAVESADLMAGGFSARYGDRMSGVLDISSVSPSRGTTNNLGVSFVNAHFNSEGLFDGGRGEWLAAVRRGYLDILLDMAGDENTVSKPRYGDMLGKVSYRIGERSKLAANLLYAWNDLELFDEEPWKLQEINGRQRNAYGWATLETAWNPSLFSRILFYGGGLDREGTGIDRVEFEQNAELEDRRDVEILGLKQDWSLKASPRHFLSLGIDAKHLRASYDFYSFTEITDPIVNPGDDPDIIERDIVLDESGWDLAAYVSDRIRLSSPLTLELGLRWDSQTYSGQEDQVSPRVNLLFRPSDKDSFRAAWGLFYQSQMIHELQVQDGIVNFFPAQETASFILGYEREFHGGLSLGVEAYRKEITDPLPRFENLFHAMDGLGYTNSDRVQVDPERAQADGIELFARSQGPGRIQWWLGYTLSRADDEIEGEWFPRNWDQTHAMMFSINYRIGERWNFNASGLYHTGWPTTPVFAEAEELPDGSYDLSWEVGRRNSIRFDDYYRLDVRASRHVNLRRGSLTLFVEVMNLLATANPCCGDSFAINVLPDGSVEVDRDFEDWMPLLPSFGIDWRF